MAQTAASSSSKQRYRSLNSSKVAEVLRLQLMRLALLVVLFAAWQLVVSTKVLNELYVGSPRKIWLQLYEWTRTGVLTSNLWVTYYETIVGWAIAGTAAILVGYLTGSFRRVDSVTLPFVDAIAAAPRLALVPLFVIWFGLGTGSKVALVVTIVGVIVYAAVNGAVKGVDQDLITVARSLGASRVEIARKVVWPWTIPFIFASLRVSMSLGLTSAVVGEMIIAQRGIGVLIARGAGAFDTNGVLAGVIVVMVLAYITSLILTRIENRILHWRPDNSQVGVR